MEQLTRAHLVERPRADRYRLHDLVRLYAVERVRADDSAERAHQAVGDVARWYVHAAARAQLAEQPNFPVVPGEGRPEELPVLGSVEEARVWFEAERTNLVTATESALEHGHLTWLTGGDSCTSRSCDMRIRPGQEVFSQADEMNRARPKDFQDAPI